MIPYLLAFLAILLVFYLLYRAVVRSIEEKECPSCNSQLENIRVSSSKIWVYEGDCALCEEVRTWSLL